MRTTTHVSDGLGLLPCRTASQANRSTCASTSPPSRTVPVTHLATSPANNYRGPKPSVENRCPAQPVSRHALATHLQVHQESQGVVEPRTLPVTDERASFRLPSVVN